MSEKNTPLSIAVIIVLIIALFFAVRGVHRYDAQIAATSTPSDGIQTSTKYPGMQTYSDTPYRFSVSYPESLSATTTFNQSYLVGSTWNLYNDSTKNTGMPIIALYKKGSNDVLNAELRIGVSTSSTDVATCTTIPSYATASSSVINGIPFISFSESDAAMSHFSNAISYRIVRDNSCYAIDEFIAGTNPEVYDPVRTLPYTKDEAWRDLNQALSTFSFK